MTSCVPIHKIQNKHRLLFDLTNVAVGFTRETLLLGGARERAALAAPVRIAAAAAAVFAVGDHVVAF